MELTKSSIVNRRGGFIDVKIDEEIVALNIDTGVCYSLNNAGVRLWTLIAEPRRVADICRTLTAEYDVDDATCESQILDLLAELQAEGMIESRVDAAAPG